jgi:hypothetical protein
MFNKSEAEERRYLEMTGDQQRLGSNLAAEVFEK